MTSRSHASDNRSTDAGAYADIRPRRHRDNEIKFLTIAEVAERFRVSTRTVRRWIKAGDLIAYRVGGLVRVAESDLRAFLAVHRED